MAKSFKALFLALPLIAGGLALILGLVGRFSKRQVKDSYITLSLSGEKVVAYQNMRELAGADFKKYILNSESGRTALMELLEYRDTDKHTSKEVYVKNLKKDKYKISKNAREILSDLAEIDRRELTWFKYYPSTEFAEEFVKRVFELEGADVTAEYVLDESFGVEGERIGNVLNSKVDKAEKIARRFGGVKALGRMFKNWRKKKSENAN